MTWVTLLALSWAFLAAPVLGADKPRLKPMQRGGYQTEAQETRTTEDETEVLPPLSQTIQTLQNAQQSPFLTPQMRQQIQGVIDQGAAMNTPGRGVEYSRPAGSASPPDFRKAMPRAGRAVDIRSIESRDQQADHAAPPTDSDMRAGAAAGGVMLSAPVQQQPYASFRDGDVRNFTAPLEKQAVWAGRAAAAHQTLEDRPSDPAALESLARAEFAQGRYSQAAEAADRAVVAAPKSADAAWLRAMSRERLGDRAGAMADANRAAELNPSRYAGRAAIAAAGGSLFDPGSDESWGLLEQMAPPASQGTKAPWVLLLLLLVTGAVAASAYAGRALWQDLPSENKQRLMNVLRKAAPKGSFPVPRAATPMPVKQAGALKAGASLGAKFDLIGQIGHDGTVAVWKAHDKTLGRDVLLKRLYSGPDSGELDLRRADAKQAAGLHHPNIVELYEIVELPEGLFAVYEYASGKSLRQVLSEKRTLSLRQTRDVLIPVCRALEHAHRRGIAHGGLSPERIILTRQGYVKVIDFVLARTTGAGTEAYAAPETRRGAPTPVSDVYSLGMVLHELLVGERPGEGDAEPPASFNRILESALDLDVRSRTQSARQFLEELRGISADTMPPRPIDPEVLARAEASEPAPGSAAVKDAAAPGGEAEERLVDPGPPTHPTNPD